MSGIKDEYWGNAGSKDYVQAGAQDNGTRVLTAATQLVFFILDIKAEVRIIGQYEADIALSNLDRSGVRGIRTTQVAKGEAYVVLGAAPRLAADVSSTGNDQIVGGSALSLIHLVRIKTPKMSLSSWSNDRPTPCSRSSLPEALVKLLSVVKANTR